MKKLLLVIMVLALVLAPLAASAQTSPAPSARDAKQADQSQNLIEARDIIGMQIKNELDKTVGTVENLLIDPKTGKVNQVVVGLGGVLGVGEKKVVVPWSDLKVAMTTDGKKPTATMNEAKLEAAPRYDRSAAAERDRTRSSPSASPTSDTKNKTK